MNHDGFYTCPMHPEIMQDKPGMCPSCGMNFIPQKLEVRGERLENKSHPTSNLQPHTSHLGHSTNIFKKKFWVSLGLTIPVVFYSDILEKLFGWRTPAFPGSQYIGFIFGSIVFFYGGWIFLASAIRELRARLPGMMTLIALAITAAYLWSVAAVIFDLGETLFWELTTLITVMLLGHWMEMRAVQGAQSALKELSKLLPDTAEIVLQSAMPAGRQANRESQIITKTVPLLELKESDIVFVRPGGKIPADGTVIEGRSEVNEALMTGESKPILKTKDSEVIAGAINGDGSLKIKITKIGEHTFLAGVMRLVAEAQASKSRLQMLSDKAAFILTIVAVLTGGLTFILWLIADRGTAFAVERLVAVLVIACPHALGLAIPLVASISTTMGARSGLLVRQRLALEAARKIDIVLFDKTGTLTKGEYGVEKIVSFESGGDEKVLRIAASVDSHSEHFAAQAIVNEAKKRKLELQPVKSFTRLAGKGVKGELQGEIIFVGGEAILSDAGVRVADLVKDNARVLAERGFTIIYVATRKGILGLIALGDLIREESKQAIQNLKNMNVKIAMVTGDSEEVARWVAEELGIDEYFARVLPDQKSEKVKELQKRGLKVAMVGDGINDAPALTQADLGIAIGAGTNVAIESAGIILVKSDPRDIVKIVKLSRLTYVKMIQNLFWATGYNIVALPLAAGVLAAQGILLQPALAAVFMSLSTVIVAINAVLLRKAKLS